MISEMPSRRLLVVDDEPLVRQTLNLVLRDDYEVTTVASGEEAVEVSMHDTFPVVILDLCMEGMSGIETLQRLKKIRDTQNVIILTAYESTETAIAALNLGAFNYLTKPFERRQLKSIVSQGFEMYQRHSARKEDMQRRLMGVHDSFFSLLCHEFNTPLNVILGFSDLMAASPRDKELINWIEHVREAGTHLHDILMEIVDYTAASHLATAGIEEIFTPRELVLPVVRTLQEKAVAAMLEDNLPPGTKVAGPSEAVLMIVRKLSAMASQRSKRIHIRMGVEQQDGPHLVIAVGGTGIYERSLEGRRIEQLFQPYEAARTGKTVGAMSLGLELATCRKIADYAHASVEGKYDARGELEFFVTVPVQVIR